MTDLAGTALSRGATFGDGVRAALRGLRLALSSRAAWRAYVVLALAVGLLSLVLGSLAAWGAWTLAHLPAVATPNGMGALSFVVLGVAGLVGLVLAPIAALVLVNLFVPFLGERLFLAALAAVDPDRARALAAGPGLPIAASALVNLRRFLRFVLLAAWAALLGLVPFAGLVLGPVAEMWVAVTTLGWELVDPYLSLRGFRYREQREWVKRHRFAVAGFALPFLLPLGVPLVGALFFPLGHAAAAVLVTDVTCPRQAGQAPAPSKSPS